MPARHRGPLDDIPYTCHGKSLSELLLYKVEHAYEQATDRDKRHPDIQAMIKGPHVARLAA